MEADHAKRRQIVRNTVFLFDFRNIYKVTTDIDKCCILMLLFTGY